MKPRNFPGRKTLRKLRAAERARMPVDGFMEDTNRPGPKDIEQVGDQHFTRDVKIRMGRKQRSSNGALLPGARPLQKKATDDAAD